ncbi:hypothetical protein BOX15_Mlig016456g1 [Macrostomum lignano]|uniref:Uncharacterized protein n=1 Tax=Macrostomum lignano TaxID=282301 RepID=A0A267FQF2_9PLAT|nr:hypothetical protein BOX15_Mlig016456g1 [Macrostomum lignano]
MENGMPSQTFTSEDYRPQYEGVFSNNKSSDFLLKVLFILALFLVLLFFTAWYITRKNVRFPMATVCRVTPTSLLLGEFLRQFTEPFVLVEFNKRRDWLFVVSQADVVYSSAFTSKLIYARPHLAFDDWKATTVYSLNYEELRVVGLLSRFAVDDLLHSHALLGNCVDEALACLGDRLRGDGDGGGNNADSKVSADNASAFIDESVVSGIVRAYLLDAVFGGSDLCDDLQPQLDSILDKYMAFFRSAHLLNPNCDGNRMHRLQEDLHGEIRDFLDHFMSDTHNNLVDRSVPSFVERFIKEKMSFDQCGITDTDFVTANHMVQEALDFACLSLAIVPDLVHACLVRVAAAPDQFFAAVSVADNDSVEAALEEIIRIEDIGSDTAVFLSTAELVCAGCLLPMGSCVAVNLHAVNRDPLVFQSAGELHWDRFAQQPEGGGISGSPLQAVHAKSPFYRFALALASALVQGVLLRYRLSPGKQPDSFAYTARREVPEE